MYAGLNTADKGALLDAKARGAEWVAREGNEEGDLFAYRKKPEKDLELSFWNSVDERWIGIENEMLQSIQWSDAEPVNIDLALAQIEEMESAEKPLTVKDVLLKKWAQDTREMATKTIRSLYNAKMDRYEIPTNTVTYLTRDTADAIEHYIAYLNSAAEVEA